MVRKIFQILGMEVSGIHQAAYLLGFFALLAQILALFRDRLLASSFGAGSVLDIYYAAFRIPDLIFVTIASLVSISILVPFFTEKKENKEDLKKFIDSIFSVFFLLMIVVVVVAFFIIPYLSPYIFPGIKGADQDTLINLSRILLLSPLILGFSNFFASIVQMHNRFMLYALSPILYNVGIILGITLLYPLFGLYGLVAGVCVGAVLHTLVQVPFIIRKKSFPNVTFKIDFPAVKKIILLSIPRTVTLSMSSISAFVLVSMASLIGVGSIAIFNFAFNLQTGPLSIIGVSYASAVFPLLSSLYVQGDRKMFLDRMITVTKHIIFWSLPISALFIVLRAQIVRTVLGAGHFSWEDTKLTAAALAIFTLSIIPQSLILLFIRAFYAEGKTRKPLVMNVVAAAVTIFSGYLFIFIYEHSSIFAFFIQSILHIENVPGSAVVMLALAYSVGITFNTLLHWVSFEREYPGYTKAIFRTAFQSFSASIIIGFVAYKSLAVFDKIFDINTLIGIFLQGLCAGVVGILIGVFVLKILNSLELKVVLQTLHKKIWKVEDKIVIDKLV